jgi:prepilin signal peptidase PulO-like enzyme (type II secretory pathway)
MNDKRWMAVIAVAGCAAMALRFGATALLPALCYLALLAAPLTVIDLRERRLPDRLTLPSYPVALALLAIPFLSQHHVASHYISALAGLAGAGAFYALLAVIYPAGLGLGDVKLSGVLGLYLGWFGLSAWFFGMLGGFLLAGLTGAGLILARRATRKTQIPYGPFMLAATLITILAIG